MVWHVALVAGVLLAAMQLTLAAAEEPQTATTSAPSTTSGSSGATSSAPAPSAGASTGTTTGTTTGTNTTAALPVPEATTSSSTNGGSISNPSGTAPSVQATASAAPQSTATSTTSTPAPSGTAAPSSTGAASTPAATGTASPSGTATPSSTTSAGAGVTTGDATAIGNLSSTQIVQVVLAILNVNLPSGFDPNQLTNPLIVIEQTANVTNSGQATANTGGNNATAQVLSSLAGGGNTTAAQLTSLITSNADVVTGSATAIGNISWTEIMQLATTVVQFNGDTSLLDRLTQISQNASVSNQGSATATTGNNQVNTGIGPSSSPRAAIAAAPASGESPPEEDAPSANDVLLPRVVVASDADQPVLIWGLAESAGAEVRVAVDGRFCKVASVKADPDLPGSYMWRVGLKPAECGSHDGSTVALSLDGQRMQFNLVWSTQSRVGDWPSVVSVFGTRSATVVSN